MARKVLESWQGGVKARPADFADPGRNSTRNKIGGCCKNAVPGLVFQSGHSTFQKERSALLRMRAGCL